jgi:hypothetical protein
MARKQKKRRRKKMAKQPFPGLGSPRQGIAPNILPGVKPEDLQLINCEKCDSADFHPSHKLAVASMFQSINGLPTLVQFPSGYACSKCGAINPFDPQKLGIEKVGAVKKEEPKSKGGDLGISVSEDIKSDEKIG